MLRLGQILGSALNSLEWLPSVTDEQMLSALNKLYATYTHFEAAGIRKEQL